MKEKDARAQHRLQARSIIKVRVYLRLNKIIIFKRAPLPSLFKLFFHETTEIIGTTAEVDNLFKGAVLNCEDNDDNHNNNKSNFQVIKSTNNKKGTRTSFFIMVAASPQKTFLGQNSQNFEFIFLFKRIIRISAVL